MPLPSKSDISLNPTSVAGDILTSNGSSRIRFAAGTNGQILVARSSSSSGLSWETDQNAGPSDAGTFVQIGLASATANNVLIYNFASIPQTYTNLLIMYTSRGNSGGSSQVKINFNSSTVSEYYWGGDRRVGTSTPNFTYSASDNQIVLPFNGTSPGTSNTSYCTSMMMINSYADTAKYKSGFAHFYHSTTSTTTQFAEYGICGWRNTSAITSITFTFTGTAVSVAGTALSIYGIRSFGQ